MLTNNLLKPISILQHIFLIFVAAFPLLAWSACDQVVLANESMPCTDIKTDEPMTTKITIKVGNHKFTATLLDNPSANAFKALLPLSIKMNELNGNEKYHRLSDNLPVNASNPGTINAGDLMLWGSDTLVIFYETFSTSYSYTRLGKIDNPTGLAAALGNGNINIAFDLP